MKPIECRCVNVARVKGSLHFDSVEIWKTEEKKMKINNKYMKEETKMREYKKKTRHILLI